MFVTIILSNFRTGGWHQNPEAADSGWHGITVNDFRLLLISAFLKLNANTLMIQSASTSAIQRMTGFIESETSSNERTGKVL
jgi:hypothetical protein